MSLQLVARRYEDEKVITYLEFSTGNSDMLTRILAHPSARVYHRENWTAFCPVSIGKELAGLNKGLWTWVFCRRTISRNLRKRQLM